MTMPPNQQEQFLNFWQAFINTQAAGVIPMLVKADEIPQVFSQSELFQILTGMIQNGDMSVNCDGSLVTKGIELPEVPISVDKYSEFLTKFKELNHCERLTFTRDGCQRYEPHILSAAYDFLGPYLEHRGLPSKGINAVFIGGDYQETWIGLHNDYCQTFLFPALGRKKMYMWHPDYFSDIKALMYDGLNGRCLGKLDISPYKKDALVFEMDAGDMLYIPPHWWHYNLLDNSEPTITISLGLFTYSSPVDYIQSALGAMNAKGSSQAPYFLKSGRDTSTILDDFEQEFGSILNQLRNRILCDYAHKKSFNGFVATEQYLEEITDNYHSAYCLPGFCKLSYQVREGRDIILLLSGKKYELPYCEKTLEALATLNAGLPVMFGNQDGSLYSLYLLLKQHRRLTPVGTLTGGESAVLCNPTKSSI